MTERTAPGAYPAESVYSINPSIDHRSFAKAEKTGRMIASLKYILPILMVILIGVFLFLTGVFSPSRKFETDKYLAEVDNIQLKKDSAMIQNLKLVGKSSKGGNYELTAGSATRKIDEPGRYFLEEIHAVLNKANGGWAKVKADKGVYDKANDILKLRDKVEIHSDSGYIARMASAWVNVDDGRLVSEVPVTVEHSSGNIKAGSMEVLERGKVFRFSKRPKMVINMSDGGKKK